MASAKSRMTPNLMPAPTAPTVVTIMTPTAVSIPVGQAARVEFTGLERYRGGVVCITNRGPGAIGVAQVDAEGSALDLVRRVAPNRRVRLGLRDGAAALQLLVRGDDATPAQVHLQAMAARLAPTPRMILATVKRPVRDQHGVITEVVEYRAYVRDKPVGEM